MPFRMGNGTPDVGALPGLCGVGTTASAGDAANVISGDRPPVAAVETLGGHRWTGAAAIHPELIGAEGEHAVLVRQMHLWKAR